MPNRLQEDRIDLPTKMHLNGTQGGSAEPTLAPVQVHFGGKLDPILLKAVWHVSMYEDGGNRPPQAIKGASHTTHHAHHLEKPLSHSLL